MDYGKYKWEVIAKDFDSPFIRSYIFTKSLAKQSSEFNISRFVVGGVLRKKELLYIADVKTWTKTHEDLKKKIEKDIYFVEKLIDKTDKLGEEFAKWTEKNIFKADLSKLSPKELMILLEQFMEKQGMLYIYGIIVPLIDFRDFSYVEKNLKRILEKKLSKEDCEKYYEVLTRPLHNSFAQDQEEDLLRLMEEFFSPKWIKDTRNKKIEELKKLYPGFYKKLQKHTEKYTWVYYVYVGPAFQEKDFLGFIKDYLNKEINPKKKLNEIKRKKETTEKLKKEYIEKLGKNEFDKMILNLAGKMVWAKPRRKDYQSKLYYHLEKLMKEIAKRLSISLNQARSIPPNMLEKALELKKIDENLLNSIYNLNVCFYKDDGKIHILYGKEAESFYSKYIPKEKEISKDIKEINGASSYPGKVKGIVRIINKPSEINKMERGDVLVSIATTPSIVPAMRKAKAIITDEGGLTCHASIVSRELEITCITGTKIATKVLRDGDLVEVDANKGIIKIIKKQNKNYG